MRLSLLSFTRFLVRAVSPLVLLLGASLLTQAQTIRYVKPTATGNGDGSSWTNASGNLQATIINASVNASGVQQQVWVAAGTYKPTTTTDRNASFALWANVTIYGGFVGNEASLSARPTINLTTPSSTTLSGDIGAAGNADNSYHVIRNSIGLATTAILDGFVITGGNANGSSGSNNDKGGGILLMTNQQGQTASPLIRNCSFQANSAERGGAMFNGSRHIASHSSPTLINCSFQANTASSFGGAMYNSGAEAQAGLGGGNSSPTLTNCIFLSNTAGLGGAMYNEGFGASGQSNPRLTNCSFQTNTASDGGAMYNGGFGSGGRSYPTLTNCSFQANTASGGTTNRGGAIFNNAGEFSVSSPTLTNCSFQANTASYLGGAMYSLTYPNSESNAELTNCVLFNNGGANTFSTDGGYVYVNSSLFDNTVTGFSNRTGVNLRVSVSPFASPNNTPLAANSPAINTGDPTTTTATVGATDLAGNPRIVGCKVDMGAFEFQYVHLPLAINAQPATSSVVCAGKAVSVPVSVSGTVQGYQWYKDSFANPVAGQTTATLTLSNPQTGDAGSYSLVVTSTCNSLTTTAFSLSVNSLPPVSISPGSATLCQGQSVLLTASGASTYTWSNNTTGNTLSATTAGTYSVTGVDGNGCSNTATATITENKPPVSISPGSATLCQGQSVLLTASGASTYTWSNNTTGNTLSATTAGTYSVTGVDGNGCSNTATATITENKPPVSISPGSVSICQGQSVLLTASGASTYTWSNNTTGNTLSATTTGTYSVTGVAGNGCSNTATASVTVNAVPSLTITASPSATITQGNSVTLTVSATGATSFTWSTGSTSSSIVVSPTTSTPYSVMARNGAGCVVSTSLTITTTPPVCGPVIYVTQMGGGLRDGSSWDNALGDNQLQIAIDAAANCGGNGQVWVATGVYKPTTGSDRNASFALRNGVALYGGFAGTETALTDRPAINPVGGPGGASQPSSTTLSGNIGTVGNSNDNSFHVLNNPTGLTTTAVLDGFVITGGAGGTQGGGMLNDGSSPTIRKCSFVGNSASAPGTTNTNQGGAMANTNSSSPQLTNCVFQSNLVAGGFTTNQGGAMANTNGSSPQLTNCVFQSNSATGSSTNPNFSKLGGAMANTNSNPKLINCAFLSNSASGSGNNLGGAMYNNVGNPQLTNCSFLGNSAGPGRAVYNISSSPKLINCVVFGNGGGSTFANSGSSSIPSSIGATFSLFDNTVTGYSSDPTNLTASTSPFASSTSVALAANSPAIDAGLNSASGLSGISTDLAGNPRLVGCKVDMGALEFQGSTNQTFAITGGPATTSVVCAGTAISVPVSVSGTVTSYQWYRDSFANPVAGQTSATLALTNVQPGDGGSYSLVVTGACNSLTSTAFSLTVNSPPTVATAGASQTITTGTGATLAANTPTLGTGSWSVVSGPSVDLAQFSNVNNPAAVFTPAGGGGSYELVWTIANAPCTPSSSSLTITVIGANTPPVATVNTSQTATVGTAFSYTVNAFTDAESPNSLTYTASISPANGFSFDPLTRVISGTPVSTLVSSVTITATDAGGLSASTSFSIITGCLPLTASVSGALTVCAGQATDLTASGGTTYVWNTGAITPTISATAGSYSVTVTTNGCSATATATVVDDQNVPTASLTNNGPLTCSTTSVTLTATGGATYRFSGGATQIGSTNQALVSTSGPYSVTVTSASGCTAVAEVTVMSDQIAPEASLTENGPLTCSQTTVTLTAGGGVAYDFSPGATPVDGSNTANVNTAGTYSVTVTAASGCTAVASVSVSQDNTQPVATLSASPSTTLSCSQTQLILSAGGGDRYVFAGPGLVSQEGSQALVNTAGVYSVTVTNSSTGCFSVTTITISQEATTQASLTASPSATLSCLVRSVTLTAGGGNTGQTLSYAFAGPGIVSQSGNQAVVNTAGVYSVTVTNTASGCSSTTTITIDQNTSGPETSLAGSGPLTCAVSSVTLTASPAGQTYQFSAGATQLGTSNQAVLSSPGLYSVTVVSGNGCTGVASLSVSQDNTQPVATLSASPSTTLGCSQTQLILSAGGGDRYVFAGPGLVSQEGSQALVNTAGVYSVTVTNSSTGCFSVTSITIGQDNSVPQASLTSSGLLTCAVTSVTLTASPNGLNYAFAGPGVVSQSGNQAIVNASGTYSVTVSNGANGCSSVASTSVSQDNTQPVATITTNSSTTLTCTQTQVALFAGGGDRYVFAGPGLVSQEGSQALVNTAGVYSVTVTNSSTGCFSVTSITISQDNSVPDASLTSSGLLTCATSSVTLTASPNGLSYAFAGPGVVSQSGNQAIVNVSGPYSVTVSDGSNGCSSVASVSVSQDNTTPVATISASPSPMLTCTQTSLTLTAGGGNAYLFSGPGVVSQSSNVAVVNASGTYSVTVTNTASGCFSVTSISISQDASAPVASLVSSGPLSCAVTSVTLTANPNGQSYQFSAGANQIGASNQATVTASGQYSVTVINGGNGCTSVASVSVVQDNAAPMVSIMANPSLTISQGQSATLTAQATGSTPPYGYSWSTGANTPSIVVSTAGPYSVTGTSANGCTGTASVTLTVQPVVTAPFAITGVTTVDCTPILPNRFSISFTPRYSGLDGSPVSFSVTNELFPTTQPGPYTLQLYTDNPVITLEAKQGGATTKYTYDWLAACNSATTPNTPPRVVMGIPAQTATVGQNFSYVIPEGTFTDTETPGSLRLSASGVPAGLSFSGATLSGVPASTVGSPFSVTITATDPGGLSASTPLVLTVQPASETPPPTVPFAITGVTTISCTPVADRININFAPRYAGLNGQPIAFEVINELGTTTEPGPYSLTLYRDNPVITLRATQTGSGGPVTYAYNWLSACQSVGQDNTPPRLNEPVGSQTAVVGQGYSLNLSNTFTDQETPDQITLSAVNLPAGLNLSGKFISGTPSMSGVSSVSLTATDGGGLSTSTVFSFTVLPASTQPPANPPTAPFSITGVTTVSCEVVSAGQRRVTFTPRYAGLDGSPVSFSVVNELLPTTSPGPYTLNLYTDNSVITLRALQGGVSSQFSYGWLAACNPGARLGAGPEVPLSVTVLGNPVVSETVEVEVRGADGQALSLSITDARGYRVVEQSVGEAGVVERQTLRLGQVPAGMLLLRVSTSTQSQTVKLLKAE